MHLTCHLLVILLACRHEKRNDFGTALRKLASHKPNMLDMALRASMYDFHTITGRFRLWHCFAEGGTGSPLGMYWGIENSSLLVQRTKPIRSHLSGNVARLAGEVCSFSVVIVEELLQVYNDVRYSCVQGS